MTLLQAAGTRSRNVSFSRGVDVCKRREPVDRAVFRTFLHVSAPFPTGMCHIAIYLAKDTQPRCPTRYTRLSPQFKDCAYQLGSLDFDIWHVASCQTRQLA